jgi:hypothetical protein
MARLAAAGEACELYDIHGHYADAGVSGELNKLGAPCCCHVHVLLHVNTWVKGVASTPSILYCMGSDLLAFQLPAAAYVSTCCCPTSGACS